ncbi:hypothetical protein [Micromonospora okii]|uniref:hypothetical protein n=1 Tax=Micromonospora okii TaxID=1182970 RepID=UPI001E2A0A18|nr:hypothetical protein [Micromonospora okii]
MIAAFATLYPNLRGSPKPDPAAQPATQSPVAPTVTPSGDPPGPLNITSRLSDDRCTDRWHVEQPPSNIPAPGDNPDGLGAWAKSVGATASGVRRVALHIDSETKAQVSVEMIRAVVIGSRSTPISGGTVVGIGCGGQGSYRALEADLDVEPPKMTSKVVRSGEEDELLNLKPVKFPIEVSDTDAEDFLIEAKVTRFDLRWQIEVDWAMGDQRGTQVVRNDGGELFRTTGSGGEAAVCIWHESGKLIQSQSRNCGS